MDDITYYKLIDIYRGLKVAFSSYELIIYAYPDAMNSLYLLLNEEKERRKNEEHNRVGTNTR